MNAARPKVKVLAVDDEPDISRVIAEALGGEYETRAASSGEQALELCAKEAFDLVLLDVRMEGIDGVETLDRLRRMDPNALVVMLSAFDQVSTAVQCMRLGAYDYLTKPLNTYELRITLSNALRTRRLQAELERLRHEVEKNRGLDRLVGDEPAMRTLRDLIQRIAIHDISVLITGDSGTGKELVAESLHLLSERKTRPFISVDCAALPEALIESELFGHEKGAFTGARERKVGRFELASGGVLFLDEIGNLPSTVQVKLLRVLQERRLTRLGSNTEVPIDVRVVAATNVDLTEAIKKGQFREDLYYRLNEFHIHVPSLRERSGDIPLLANYFLHRFNLQFGRQVLRFSEEAMAAVKAYAWTGNVRELQNTMKRAVILAEDAIEPAHLPPEVSGVGEEAPGGPRPLKEMAEDAVQVAEAEMIRRALQESRWNKQKAAKLLQIDYKTLFNKIKEYQID
jgi:DNA-binding NtrC family response regulator